VKKAKLNLNNVTGRVTYRALCCALLVLCTVSFAQDSSQDLAKKLSNPVASLISVRFQFNYDEGYGPNEGQ